MLSYVWMFGPVRKETCRGHQFLCTPHHQISIPIVCPHTGFVCAYEYFEKLLTFALNIDSIHLPAKHNLADGAILSWTDI